MASRGRTRKADWNKWLYKRITKFLVKIEFVLYVTFCVKAYTLVYREALPGEFSLILLGVLLLQGFPSGQSRDKAAALARGILEAILEALLD
jgi:hypothetical protein